MGYRCSFCGDFSHFAEMASCSCAPMGFHHFVQEQPQYRCSYCGELTLSPAAGACRCSPWGRHEYT